MASSDVGEAFDIDCARAKRTMSMPDNLIASAVLAAIALFGGAAAAQTPGGWPAASTPSVLPRPDFHFPGNVGRTSSIRTRRSSRSRSRRRRVRRTSCSSCSTTRASASTATFGGASRRRRWTARRRGAALHPLPHHGAVQPYPGGAHHRPQPPLGRNGQHHRGATGYDGYTGVLPRSTGTVGEVLRQNGYMTAWIGKNHNTPTWEASAAGPFDRWANGLGFDYFYGFNGGDMNHWNPVLYENRNLVPASTDPDYHLTTDLADHAIAWVRKVKSIAPDKPFFLYVAPGATHSPHQVPEGVDRQVQGPVRRGLGQVPRGDASPGRRSSASSRRTRSSPRGPTGLPAWDTLNADQKRLYARMMEVFAGYGAQRRPRDGPRSSTR